MNKKFLKRVVAERIVKTAHYAYVCSDGCTSAVQYIERYPLHLFGTRYAYRGLKVIAVVVGGVIA